MSDTITAIPTVYKGVQLRSRLEAQVALLFDRLGWKWEYESKSLMLPTGIAYRPDFWLPDHQTVVEVRGYDSDTGNQQLRDFADFVSDQEMGPHCTAPEIIHYVVLGPNSAWSQTWCCRPEPQCLSIPIIYCFRCKSWRFSGWSDPKCFGCQCSNWIGVSLAVVTAKGKVYVNGKSSRSWDFEIE